MRSLLICSLATILILVSTPSSAQTLSVELAAKEAQLSTLADNARAYFQGRCSYLSSSTCSVAACGATFKADDGFDCVSGYGSDCGDSCPGMTRSLSKSTIWIPQSTDFSSIDAQAFVASTTGVDSAFASARTASSGSLNAWQLIGDSTGVTRVFPGNPQDRDDTCTDYDARTRPWYVAAASGPKDLVLLLDISGSMTTLVGLSQTSREELLRPAVDAILDTLTQNDFVSIVVFSGSASALKSTPVSATAANIASLKSLWAGTTFGGGTYFGLGFTKAFDMLSQGGDVTSGCTKVILFLTDGTASDGNDYSTAIANGQSALVNADSSKAHIFAVTMGADADTVVPKSIACSNDGVYESIAEGSDPLVALRGYYQFLAAGLTNDDVRWSNPYTDAFGLGQMVTAGIPIYDKSQSLPILVGVAGADVTLTELEKYADYNTVVSELLTRSKTCPVTNFTECNLQQLRESSSSGYVCPSPQATPASCRAGNDAVTRSSCSQQGTKDLNSFLCDELVESTLLQASGSISTVAAQCCGSIEGGTDYSGQCLSGASSLTVIVAATVSVMSAVAALLL